MMTTDVMHISGKAFRRCIGSAGNSDIIRIMGRTFLKELRVSPAKIHKDIEKKAMLAISGEK